MFSTITLFKKARSSCRKSKKKCSPDKSEEHTLSMYRKYDGCILTYLSQLYIELNVAPSLSFLRGLSRLHRVNSLSLS